MKKLSRRSVLKSSTATLLLPILEANAAPVFAAASSKKIPQRLVFLSMGFGVNAQNWFPSTSQLGSDYELPSLLESFSDLKEDFSIIQGLRNAHIFNAHASSTNFLTSVNPRNDKGQFANAVSCDQIAAELLGQHTRHSSLAVGPSISNNDGHGGRFGYASWNRQGKPLGVYRKLHELYGALFGTGGSIEELIAQLEHQKSSLDLLMRDAKRLSFQISANDKDRVDEYFTTIRSIEKRLARAREWTKVPYPEAPFDDPAAGLKGVEELEIAMDLLLAAIQSDSTRVLTYMLPVGTLLRGLGARVNAHQMSHKGSGGLDPKNPHQMRDRALAEQTSRFVRKLKETKEYDGSSLLDHSLVAFGSGLRQGHSKTNVPMLLAGHGGGGLKQGQNLLYPTKTPIANLWLSMIRHVGVLDTKFADSKGVLKEMGFS